MEVKTAPARYATDLSFCPPLEALTAATPLTGRSGRTLTRYPISTVNNLVVLRNLAMYLRPKNTLEVGLACGSSAMAFAASHRDMKRSPAGQHIAIDPLQSSAQGYDSTGLDNLARAGLQGYVRFIDSRSSSALPSLLAGGTEISLAYIDGSHLFEDVFIDFYYVHRLLAQRGVVCFDDCAWPDVRKVIAFIKRNFCGHLLEYDLAPYRPDHGRSLRYRVANVFGRRQLRAFIKIGPSSRRFRTPFRDF